MARLYSWMEVGLSYKLIHGERLGELFQEISMDLYEDNGTVRETTWGILYGMFR